MNTLIFKQTRMAGRIPVVNAILNGVNIDSCDMCKPLQVTQAHVIIAGVYLTLDSTDLDITIEGVSEENQYPLVELVRMAKNLMLFPELVRTYRL